MNTFAYVGSTASRQLRTIPIALLMGLSIGALGACSSETDISGTAGMMQPRSVGGLVTQHPMGGDARAPGGGEEEQEPVPGSRVELWKDLDADGLCDERIDSASANQEGRYQFNDIEEGRYCIGAIADPSGEISATDMLDPPNADASVGVSESFEISASASEGETVDVSLN